MKRDIANIKRNLEDKQNNDIIYKKYKLEEMFNEDPDIKEILGTKELLPRNKFVNPNSPTEEELAERKKIDEYNRKAQKKQILPYLKLNGIQKEVLNFLMFEIDDKGASYTNPIIKTQVITVMCLVHEDDMETEYGILRTDLLSYLVKDLLNWSNALGMQMQCTKDYGDIIDSKYYCRTIAFTIEAPNQVQNGGSNPYDEFFAKVQSRSS